MNAIEHWWRDPAARAAAQGFDRAAIVESAIAVQQIPAPTLATNQIARSFGTSCRTSAAARCSSAATPRLLSPRPGP